MEVFFTESYGRIVMLAERAGISISGLSKLLNLGNYTISRWETADPKVSNLSAVADYFNVSLDYLAGRTDNPAFGQLEYKPATYKVIELVETMELSDLELEAVNGAIAGIHAAFQKAGGEGNKENKS